MEFKFFVATVGLIVFWLITAVLGLNSGGVELQRRQAEMTQYSVPYDGRSATAQPMAPVQTAPLSSPSLGQGSPPPPACPPAGASAVRNAAAIARPPERLALADPTNYGERFQQDVFGRPVSQRWLVVLHETVNSAASAVRFFQTPHPRDEDQASYHTLITRDGTVVYVVPPEKRAYGAANSVFVGPEGPETVKTHAKLAPSVNNFAYHVSLETPPDGANNRSGHSGYTEAQYQSLAWLVAQIQVPETRITTHQQVDRSGERYDPRSFKFEQFLNRLRTVQAEMLRDRCSQAAQEG